MILTKNSHYSLYELRATSIRPSERKQKYETPFTRTKRHTFVDIDYTYTDAEEKARREHKNKYTNFIRERSESRKKKDKSK